MDYLNDPTQFPEFGYNFFQGDGFSYRYQLSKKLFFKSIYIPLGPKCESALGLDNFLKHVNSLRFTKIKLDLPMIYSKANESEILRKITAAGFKKSEYVHQDEETIIVLPEDLEAMSGSEMKRIRKSLRGCDMIIKDLLSDDELNEIYDIYKIATERLGVKPKDKSVFKKLSEKCLVALAYDKETKKLEGFQVSYVINTDLSKILNKTNGKVMLFMFTGLTDKGRDLRLGRAVHYELLKQGFDNFNIDASDLRGASRTKNRSYTEFKSCFSKRFVDMPGSFEKIKLI